jgi:hypothetical protein
VLDVDNGFAGSQNRGQLVSCHDIARTIQEGEQNSERLFRGSKADAALPELASPRVYLKRAETNRACRGRSVHGGPREAGTLYMVR